MSNARKNAGQEGAGEEMGQQQANVTPQSFQRAIYVELVEDTDNCYSAFAERNWCGDAGTRAFGGWTNCVVFNATRKYFSTKYADKDQPDPIGITTQYLLPLPSGPVKLVIRDVRIGRAQSVVQVEVQQGEVQAARLCTLATVTHGNIATEDGLTLPAEKLTIPDRADCGLLITDFVRQMVPAMANVTALSPTGGEDNLWTPTAGRNTRDTWFRFTDQPSGWDLLSLGYFSDICAPIPWNYAGTVEAGIKSWDIRTMSIAIDIRRDPKGEKWLLMRSVMHEARNGRSDNDIKIINGNGELVAIVHQVNIAIPTSKRSKKERKDDVTTSLL